MSLGPMLIPSNKKKAYKAQEMVWTRYTHRYTWQDQRSLHRRVIFQGAQGGKAIRGNCMCKGTEVGKAEEPRFLQRSCVHPIK